MLGQHSPSHALVRAVSDNALADGDVTFAIGFAVLIGGGTLGLLTASALRLVGVL